jgi:hypothetical protein
MIFLKQACKNKVKHVIHRCLKLKMATFIRVMWINICDLIEIQCFWFTNIRTFNKQFVNIKNSFFKWLRLSWEILILSLFKKKSDLFSDWNEWGCKRYERDMLKCFVLGKILLEFLKWSFSTSLENIEKLTFWSIDNIDCKIIKSINFSSILDRLKRFFNDGEIQLFRLLTSLKPW